MSRSRSSAQNGSACRDFRLKAQLTVDEAAAMADMSAPHLRNIEHEHRSASDDHLALLARIYETRLDSLRRDDLRDTGAEQNGYACRDFRLKAGLTVDQAADRAGISAPHLRNIEHEHRSANAVHLERLAVIYDVRVSSLRRLPVSQKSAVSA